MAYAAEVLMDRFLGRENSEEMIVAVQQERWITLLLMGEDDVFPTLHFIFKDYSTLSVSAGKPIPVLGMMTKDTVMDALVHIANEVAGRVIHQIVERYDEKIRSRGAGGGK